VATYCDISDALLKHETVKMGALLLQA